MHIKHIYAYLAEKALNIETVVKINSRERQDTVVDIGTRVPNGIVVQFPVKAKDYCLYNISRLVLGLFPLGQSCAGV